MRKVIAFILVTVMLLPIQLSTIGSNQAYAASNAQKVINALEIMETDKGEVSSDTAKITRAQYAQLLVNMSSLKDSIAVSSNISLFSDVSKKHWAAGYIKSAVSNGWMYGYLDGSFKPNQGVTLIEAVNGVLKLLGYTDSDFGGNITANKMALFSSKKLNKNVTVSKKTSSLSYNNCINLFYNVLNATTKDGRVYAQALGYALDEKGELDYLSIVSTDTEGPIIAGNSWTSILPFSLTSGTFYKNDVKCSYTDINKFDVIYYSEGFETVWAYDTKVTGVLSAINPDLLNPSTITVAGVAYSFETSTAAQEFSSIGTISKGDIVTLLLGKNNAIAGVLTKDEYSTTITGLVLSSGTHRVEDSKGNYLITKYVTFVDAAGNLYTQDYDDETVSFMAEDIIQVNYENGTVSVSEYNNSSVTLNDATFNGTGTVIGGKKLASNVKVLDYNQGKYITVYPIRLADMMLLNSMIYYYDTNVSGEIQNLILHNATGDLDSYGIFTGFTFTETSETYNYILNGKSEKLGKFNYGDFSITQGPTGFRTKNDTITASYALTKVTVDAMGTSSITSGTSKYLMADKVSVYYLDEDGYVLTTLDKISDLLKYKVTAYCDKTITLGGRVRVIVAEAMTK
jgi:hypothetical protein